MSFVVCLMVPTLYTDADHSVCSGFLVHVDPQIDGLHRARLCFKCSLQPTSAPSSRTRYRYSLTLEFLRVVSLTAFHLLAADILIYFRSPPPRAWTCECKPICQASFLRGSWGSYRGCGDCVGKPPPTNMTFPCPSGRITSYRAN